MTADQRRAEVWRITVDERLADDLIRVARCRLAEGVTEFWDRTNEWGREYSLLISPANYRRKLHIPPEQELSWDVLEEGQVFLEGAFRKCQSEDALEEEAPVRFEAKRGCKAFLRVDEMDAFRDSVKAAYSVALRER